MYNIQLGYPKMVNGNVFSATCLFLAFCFCYGYSQKSPEGEGCPEISDKNALQLYEKGTNRSKYPKKERYRYLKEAVEIEPEFAKAWWTLATEAINSAIYDGTSLKTAKQYLLKTAEACPKFHPFVYYYLGSIYFGAEEYSEAAKYLKQFLVFDLPHDYKYPKDYETKYAEAEQWLKKATFFSELLGNPVPFNPTVVEGISTAGDEYLAIISPDDELAMFTQKHSRLGKNDIVSKMVEEFSWSHKTDSGFATTEALPPPFNIGDAYGGATISIDNSCLYITSCKPNTVGYNNCDIFSSNYEYIYDDRYDAYRYRWSELKNIGANVNTINGWEAQPSISSDGKTIYFAGAREDSKGMDIYITRMDSSGIWGKAQRLGAQVNTDKNEKSPFIHSDSQTLYFSSDGLPGLGGYDIFYTRMDESGSWSPPVNLGFPINTKDNEVGFFVSADGKTGYFASNTLKEKGKGGYDIFSFPLYEKARPQKVLLVKGEVHDENGQPPANLKIELKNLNTKEVTQVKVNEQTGKYAIAITLKDADDDFLVNIKKDEYAFTTKYITTKDTGFSTVTKVDMNVKPIEVGDAYRLHHINFETNSINVLSQKSMAILDEFAQFLEKNPSITIAINGHTDNVGAHESNMDLSQRRAKAVHDYLILSGTDGRRLSFNGFGDTKPVAGNDSDEGRALNRRTEFVVIKL